ncbi:hypothetical protein POV27_02165 [Aureisphaera galaxeae]|uniref:hypothetical protein n=1 Tax=Aureisphaera galaxeae TaxID=1538023 RepID=UPI002350C63A|nr:hypothetical protein [Aureisphaera galaxeae]MDC8002846.1 hypothetical protein [Aureisphaera galaxeae]
MKFMNLPTRMSSFLLALLFVLQGCTVYKGSITLEQAVNGQRKVKVITSDSDTPKEYEKITLVDGEYRGTPKRYSQGTEEVIDTSKIVEIKEHDKTLSTIISFSPLVVIVAAGILLFSSESENEDREEE